MPLCAAPKWEDCYAHWLGQTAEASASNESVFHHDRDAVRFPGPLNAANDGGGGGICIHIEDVGSLDGRVVSSRSILFDEPTKPPVRYKRILTLVDTLCSYILAPVGKYITSRAIG